MPSVVERFRKDAPNAYAIILTFAIAEVFPADCALIRSLPNEPQSQPAAERSRALPRFGHLERATFSNIEHQAIEVVTDTIRPWAVAWEQAMTRDLFTEDLRRTHMLAFNLDGLLRGDIESRYRAYATGRQWGWLSANDVREREDMNRIDGGYLHLAPVK